MNHRFPRSSVAAALTLSLLACTGERPMNLGLRNGVLTACPASPNCVSSFATDERHRIAPLVFPDEPEVAFDRLKQVLGRRSDVVLIDIQPDYLRAEMHTLLFVDDAEFLLDRSGKVIHIRSASRLGNSDLGKNRRRMEEIRAQFAAAGH